MCHLFLLLLALIIATVHAGIYPTGNKNAQGNMMCWSTLDSDAEATFECPEYNDDEPIDYAAVARQLHQLHLDDAKRAGATAEQLEKWKTCYYEQYEVIEDGPKLQCYKELHAFVGKQRGILV